MLAIRQFHYGSDNLGYLIYGRRACVAIDGGAVESILEFIRSRGLALAYVSSTHEHPDHTSGNRRLLEKTGARLLKPSQLEDGRIIDLDGEPIAVYRTPGHTSDSVCFLAGRYLISGDTLFNGTVGNCFSGDLESFYRSIKKIMSLPEDTIVYAGHDYVNDSMAYAAKLEPENAAIREYLARYSPDHVFSTLREEFQMNPFLRLNEPGIKTLLGKKGLPNGTERERWESLMTMD